MATGNLVLFPGRQIQNRASIRPIRPALASPRQGHSDEGPPVTRARRSLFSVITACLLAAGGTTVALAAVGGSAPRWSAARFGPGVFDVQLLNLGSGFTMQDSLVCPFPRDCTVFYRGTMTSPRQPGPLTYAVNLRRGRWGRPGKIPGFATVSFARYDCVLPDTCLAAGTRPEPRSPQVSVAVAAVEVRGTWRSAKPIPGVPAHVYSYVTADSCARSGWCTLAGVIQHRAGRYFLIGERRGAWTRPRPVPGPVGSISCDHTATCTAVGSRPNGLFAVTGTAGTWGPVHPITEPAAFKGASLGAVACASPGNCTAIGEYGQESQTAPQVFAVTERHGTWGTPAVLPGTTGYHPISGDLADTMVTGLSCPGPGQCVMTAYHASDTYGEYDNIDQARPFISAQVNGAWQRAHAVRGLAALNRGGVADLASVSCGSPGNCAVTGIYSLAGCNAQVCRQRAFLASETGGTWGPAQPVPGLTAQATGSTVGAFISCSRAAGCAAIGARFPHARLWVSVRG